MTTTPPPTTATPAPITSTTLWTRRRALETRRAALQADVQEARVSDPEACARELGDIARQLQVIGDMLPAAEAREREARRRAEAIFQHQLLDDWEARIPAAVAIAAEIQAAVDAIAVKIPELQAAVTSGELRRRLSERHQNELYVVAGDGGALYEAVAAQLRVAGVLRDEQLAPWDRNRRFPDWVRAWTTKFAAVARRALPARPDDTDREET